MKDIAIVALGGNAFARPDEPLTMARQFQVARDALAHLLPLLTDSAPLVLTHGNGPQVGHILVRVEEALGKAYAIPLEICVAESAGELGYVLEQTLHNLLADHAIKRPLVSLLTQVVVKSDDPAFVAPTKPIGPFYTAEQAAELSRKGFVVREDAGRGWRRVVPSPAPRRIVEAPIIGRLLSDGVLVIAVRHCSAKCLTRACC
jgi:carbamate kinase